MATLAEMLRQTGYAKDGQLQAPAPTQPNLSTMSADYIRQLPQKFNENQAEQMALLARAFPDDTLKNADTKAMAEMAMQTPFNALTAFHGTPHKILGKFDISKAGTGEGAQAYGHGMYFAESKDLADVYRKKLTNEAGNPVKNPNDSIQLQMGRLEDQIKQLKQSDDPNAGSMIKAYQSRIDEINKAGNLYKVDIPDEYIPKMLNYDMPIKNQPELYELVRSNIKDPDIRKTFEHNAEKGITGANVYQNYIGGKTDADRSANALKIGIKGIRYLDEGSRSAGKGTSNFVVFDPSNVKILEENSKPIARKELIQQQIDKIE